MRGARLVDEHVEAVLATSRLLMSVVADSVAPIAEFITIAQYRALVIVANNGPLNLNEVAASLGVHPSNATRACDRLVEAGLLARTESLLDRRRVDLTLTASGIALIQRVADHRRDSIERVLARMAPEARAAVADALGAFVAAAHGEPHVEWAEELRQVPALVGMN
jgi:DNA-binding MarR family transcriptional regulator